MIKRAWEKIKDWGKRFWKWITGVLIVSAVGGTAMLGLLPLGETSYGYGLFSYDNAGAVNYVVAQWEWNCEEGCQWQAPKGMVTVFDLRTFPEQQSFQGPIEEDKVEPAIDLGIEELDANDISLLEKAFGISGLQALTVTDFVWEMLTTYSDPTGETGLKPLIGKMSEEVILILDGKPVKAERFNEEHRERAVAVFQDDYRQNKAEGESLNTLQKWTGKTMEDLYGVKNDATADKILPPEFKSDGWKNPRTIITEDWNCVDSTSPDCDLDWTEVDRTFEIFSNKLTDEATFSNGIARVESDLSTSNHYAQAEVSDSVQTGCDSGVATRFSSSASTTYLGSHRNNTVATYRIAKMVGGTITSLLTLNDTALSGGEVEVDKLSSDGSNHELTASGTVKIMLTDTSITGNLRTGIYGGCNGARRSTWDNFEAADISAAAGTNLRQRVETFTSSGTFLTPFGITSVNVEAWAAGGGGTTNVGGGGGGAYAASTTVPVTAGTSYTVTVGTSAINTDGGNSSFNTTDVVAAGGLSGTNLGLGGTTALSTGAVKFAGGNGTTGINNQSGGGGAGDTGAGSGTTGGTVTGGYSASANGSVQKFGAGGGSTSAAGFAGAAGEVRITYTQGTPDNYAYITNRSYNRLTTAGTSHTITMPSGIVSGDLLLAVFTNDGTATSSPSADWTSLSNAESDANQSAIYYKSAAGSDTLTVTTSASVESSHVVFLIKNGGTPTATVASSTATTNANPPSHNAGSSAKYLWIATGGWDASANLNSVSVPPTGYSDLIFQPTSSASGGAYTAVSDRFEQKQTEDPGTWTSTSESWVSFTIAVPFLASAAATSGGLGDDDVVEY